MADDTFLTGIVIDEPCGMNRQDESVTVGVPFPKGLLTDADRLCLKSPAGDTLPPVQSETTARWPDNSIKWTLLDFQASIKAGGSQQFMLHRCKDNEPGRTGALSAITTYEKGDNLYVDTGAALFAINRTAFNLFDSVVVDGNEVIDTGCSKILLTDGNSVQHSPVVTNACFETKGKLRTVLKLEGEFRSAGRTVFALFFARIQFFCESSIVRTEFTILNPNAATHVGGLWDLGDPGSVFFDDLHIRIGLKSDSRDIVTEWRDGPDEPFSQVIKESLVVYQDSSGGDSWNNSNNLNRDGEVKTTFCGYKVSVGQRVVKEGRRASPVIAVKGSGRSISAAVKEFWQNCPKSIETEGNTLTIRLFPQQYNDLFELQAGEQKTHTFFLDFGQGEGKTKQLESADYTLLPHCTPEWYAATGVLGHLLPLETTEQKYHGLVTAAVSKGSSFFDKRETIDEYGWRNFGEFYGDHEAVDHAGAEPLISHYNNQYDGIYCTLLHFAASGNADWFTLADQLAHHVADIDIYHTDNDRPEYNHGLLWHTEHYTDVQTATHRCFSRLHTDGRDIATYGGGPSTAHLYSTGLLLHYYMTGSLLSLDAAKELIAFASSNLYMSKSLSTTVVNLVRKMKNSSKGTGFSLDGPGRSSGNMLNTFLDGWLLTGNAAYMVQAEELIAACIHPYEDIAKRDLLDTENKWMYTVFLQALGKYLEIKTNDCDYMWNHAKESLLAYARWMVKNEYPYLTKPEKLEFPNETWAAQEIRKCNVLLYAAKYADTAEREVFIKKAAFFHEYAMNYLFTSKRKELTRSVVLVMLNGMMYEYFNKNGFKIAQPDWPVPAKVMIKPPDEITCMVKALTGFSLKREVMFWRWRIS